ISLFCSVFFFFQAEDGIRDFHVTGVQTCALPISYFVRKLTIPPGTGIRPENQPFFAPEVPYSFKSCDIQRQLSVYAKSRVGFERSEERRVGKEGRSRWSQDR